MKPPFIIFIIIDLLICSCGCNQREPYCKGEWDTRMIFFNNSDSNLWVVHSSGYPDTSLINDNYKYGETYVISHTHKVHYELCTWEDFFKDHIANDTLLVLIGYSKLKPEDIIENGFNELNSDFSILKQYNLTIEDLENMNWIITYP
jgi:hypothetical protein